MPITNAWHNKNPERLIASGRSSLDEIKALRELQDLRDRPDSTSGKILSNLCRNLFQKRNFLHSFSLQVFVFHFLRTNLNEY